MARPARNNVDYFPFMCKEGKTMFYIEERYGNDGFASWIKILRQLAVTDYHYLNLSNRVELMYLASKCKVSEDVLISIINDLTDMGEFDSDLWKNNKILFSVKFINHISDAYTKRNNKCITLPGLRVLLQGLGVLKPSKCTLKGVDNPQSIVEYTKEDKTILPLRAFELPFDSDNFLNSWIEWEQFRRELKKKITPSTAKKQLKFLGARAEPEAIEIINQSITNGWTGLFEIKKDGKQKIEANKHSLIEGFAKRVLADRENG